MTAPELSRRDVEAQIKLLIDAGRKRFLMAFPESMQALMALTVSRLNESQSRAR